MSDSMISKAALSMINNPNSGTSAADRLRQANVQDPEKLDSVCQEMESIFLNQLLKEMRATIQDSGLLSGGPGKDVYTSLMDSHLAADISKKGGIGLAQVLRAQLSGRAATVEKENTAQESRGLADDSIE